MNARDLMAGYSTYTSAEELAMDIDNGALAITPATPSSIPCSTVVSVSVDNTFDHGC